MIDASCSLSRILAMWNSLGQTVGNGGSFALKFSPPTAASSIPMSSMRSIGSSESPSNSCAFDMSTVSEIPYVQAISPHHWWKAGSPNLIAFIQVCVSHFSQQSNLARSAFVILRRGLQTTPSSHGPCITFVIFVSPMDLALRDRPGGWLSGEELGLREAGGAKGVL
jgi:hypothetical protein